MRILQLISSAGFFGAESVLLELSRELRTLGHDVTVGVFHNLQTPNLDVATQSRNDGLRTEIFACRGRIDLSTVASLARFGREHAIEIIHSHGYKSNTYAWLSNFRNRRFLVATCHNWIYSNSKMRFYSLLDRLVLKSFDAVVPVSRTVREELIRAGFRAGMLPVIENGVNVEKFRSVNDRSATRADLGLTDQDFVIGTVGRLSREKGHAVLLRAAQDLIERHGECRVLIVGDGEDRQELESLVHALSLAGRVMFTGTRQDVPRLLRAIDLFVLPSFVEAQPMSLLEAMMAGVPAVATTVGDIPHILQQGKLGGLVPAGDVQGLARAIESCIDDRDSAHQRAQSARQYAIDVHSSSRMAREYVGIYGRASSLQRSAWSAASVKENRKNGGGMA